MSDSKRPADNISGADDLDELDLPKGRRHRLEDSTIQDATDKGHGTSTDLPYSQTMKMIGDNGIAIKVDEFRKRLLNSLPVNLMTAEFKNYIFYNSNERLEEAKRAGASLAEITVGDDCLPTWPGRAWDPTEESLHDFIQAQLTSHHEARQAGKLGAAADEAIAFLYEDEDEEQLSRNNHEDDFDSTEDNQIEHTPETEGTMYEQATGVGSSDASFEMDMTSPGSSDSDSDSDTDMEDEEENFDDEISVDNMFDAQPDYSDPDDDEEANVFHDAEVVGLSSYHTSVDLEIFVVEDYDEVQDLPEMELSIDQEAYEQLFGSEGAVDVEIEGSHLLCTGEVFADEEEMTLAQVEDFETGVVVRKQGVGSLVDTSKDTADAQVPQDKVVNDIFQETEDGFTW
ncbi:hypothetical protein FSARC_2056 [Fusarium sarcochroum]|uniref:Uncharacterized protein n=1 Tax=Fusarium sarcochroum TaxID=1208366 RepID=A0A8H4XDD6_9HYPO|nr:hypothetical protein FSARC_2056 [Fusarium sarcochroum]